MPERRLPMRQIKEVLRLHHEAHLSERQNRARVPGQPEHRAAIPGTGLSRRAELATAGFRRRHATGTAFPPPSAHSETPAPQPGKAQPDCVQIHQELTANRSVTLQLLWQELSRSTPTAPTTAGSASNIETGPAIWTWCCGRNTAPARRPSSITPATPFRSSIHRTVRYARRSCSWPCSAPATTPTPKPPGPAGCRIGSARIRARWPSSTGPRG